MLELTKEGLLRDLKDKKEFFENLSQQNERDMADFDFNYSIVSYFKGKKEAYQIAAESIDSFISIIEKFY